MSDHVGKPLHIRWPADRFYWSVLEASGWTGRGELPAGLVPLVEDDVPDSAGSLHAVGALVDPGRVLACALPRATLDEVDQRALSLCPEDLPPEFSGEVQASALNMLVGAFEPRAMRRSRMRRHCLGAATVTACAGLLALGLARRAHAWEDGARQANQATSAVLGDVGALADPDALARALDRERHATALGAQFRPPADAAAALERLLAGWPAQVPSRPQSLAVSGTDASFSVTVDGDPTSFLSALRVPQGWVLDEPRLNTADQVTRLSLQIRKAAGPP